MKVRYRKTTYESNGLPDRITVGSQVISSLRQKSVAAAACNSHFLKSNGMSMEDVEENAFGAENSGSILHTNGKDALNLASDELTQRSYQAALLKQILRIREQVRMYSFKNDHIVRGPLCRVMGLVTLLKNGLGHQDAEKILQMLHAEVQTMDDVTVSISKELSREEQRLQQIIERYTNRDFNPNQIDDEK